MKRDNYSDLRQGDVVGVRWVAFLGCRIFSRKKIGDKCWRVYMYELRLNCLGFAFIDFKSNKNLLYWKSFQKLPEIWEATFLFSYIARFPACLYEFYQLPQIYWNNIQTWTESHLRRQDYLMPYRIPFTFQFT